MVMWFPVALEVTLLKLELVIDTIDEGLVLADAEVTVETIMVRDWNTKRYLILEPEVALGLSYY